ncbi:MAG: DUF202 domain-containing protein [Euzebyaceae bacterium]|nr:DUF202 domain-containing protein [Euzebyaceae bacterium]
MRRPVPRSRSRTGLVTFRQPRRDLGHEPDYRFSFANERTFLAWIRTALALDAGGLAVVELLPPFPVPYGREALGAALVVLGAIIAAVSYGRWVTNQEALRLDAPLPSSHLPRVVAIGVAVLSALAVGLLIGGRGA